MSSPRRAADRDIAVSAVFGVYALVGGERDNVFIK